MSIFLKMMSQVKRHDMMTLMVPNLQNKEISSPDVAAISTMYVLYLFNEKNLTTCIDVPNYFQFCNEITCTSDGSVNSCSQKIHAPK